MNLRIVRNVHIVFKRHDVIRVLTAHNAKVIVIIFFLRKSPQPTGCSNQKNIKA